MVRFDIFRRLSSELRNLLSGIGARQGASGLGLEAQEAAVVG